MNKVTKRIKGYGSNQKILLDKEIDLYKDLYKNGLNKKEKIKLSKRFIILMFAMPIFAFGVALSDIVGRNRCVPN
jgi:hypothetical protein